MIPWDEPRGIFYSCHLALRQWYLTFSLARTVTIPWDEPRGIFYSCHLALCQWYLTFSLAEGNDPLG